MFHFKNKSLMKSILSFCLVVLTASAMAQTKLAGNAASVSSLASVSAAFNWTETSFDFGTIDKGVPVTHKFVFTNNGTAPLLIQNVEASCGCTVTEYSKDPVPPGGTGTVSATYNAAKTGVFHKTVTVRANTTGGAIQLSITGSVAENK
jgi:hypothetical protein